MRPATVPSQFRFGLAGQADVEQAQVRAVGIRPRHLAFDAEHPGAGLPVEARLTARQEAADLAAAVRERQAREGDVGPVLVAPHAADVAADVEAAPVIQGDRCDDRRFSNRPRAEVGCR